MKKDFGKIAVFWDNSYLWGLIAWRAFADLGLDFELLTAEQIRTGALDGSDVLFVPGGWASDKILSLGDEGARRIREFVRAGGGYLGFCGGAGLALTHKSGLGLTPIGRLPASIRVPSFSGRIGLRLEDGAHPAWQGIAGETEFYAWWPGQFALGPEAAEVRVLARYGRPGNDSYVTDLPVDPHVDWNAWEQSYGINLNPERIEGEPAVIEAAFGEGRVLLSYLHFETPGDAAGHRVLLNMLGYLRGAPADREAARESTVKAHAAVGRGLWRAPAPSAASAPEAASEAAREAAAAAAIERAAAALTGLQAEAAALAGSLAEAAQLLEFGRRNFLWFQRNDWLLQWRRGVRGIEYSTLYAMLRQLAELAGKDAAAELAEEKMARLQKLVPPFCEDAQRLLMLERRALSRGPLSPLKTDDPVIAELREKLFSTSRRCGGLYREIVDLADAVLLPLLRKK